MEACGEGQRRMEEEDRGGQGSTAGCGAIVEEDKILGAPLFQMSPYLKTSEEPTSWSQAEDGDKGL